MRKTPDTRKFSMQSGKINSSLHIYNLASEHGLDINNNCLSVAVSWLNKYKLVWLTMGDL